MSPLCFFDPIFEELTTFKQLSYSLMFISWPDVEFRAYRFLCSLAVLKCHHLVLYYTASNITPLSYQIVSAISHAHPNNGYSMSSQ